jgi:hypothetical protein
MNQRFLTLVCGLALLIPAWIGLFLRGFPTILCPMPALTVIPAFLLANAGLYRIAIAVPVVFFFLWNPHLLRGRAEIPKRTYFLFVTTILLSIIWFVGGWKYGLEYRGSSFTYSVCVVNALWIALLCLLFIRSWKRNSSFPSSLALHWALFVWLAWYAFPYLGELP